MSEINTDIKIMGDTLEEKVKSLEGIINSLNRKPSKQVVKTCAACPITGELNQKEVQYPALLTGLAGSIQDFVVFIKSTTSKNIKVRVHIETENESRMISMGVKQGFNSETAKIEVEKNTLISVSFYVPEGDVTTPPIVSFTFKEGKDVSPA